MAGRKKLTTASGMVVDDHQNGYHKGAKKCLTRTECR